MCGRFVVRSDLSIIKDVFDIEEISVPVRKSENCVPGQTIAAIIHDGNRRLVPFYWGLIPFWANDRSIARRLFNARAETIAEKPSFRDAFKKRRCLIPADAFYEWQKKGNVKNPFLIFLKTECPFGLAGVFESWVSPENETIDTCTIITTKANDLIEPIHDRMPVIVPKDKQNIWLDPACRDPFLLRSLLMPYPAEEMDKMAVSDRK